MTRPARLGYVPLALTGRMVELRFSWAAIDAGGGGSAIVAMFEQVERNGADSLSVLADLVALASGGVVTSAEVAEASPPVQVVATSLARAWTLAMHGTADGEGRDRSDPRNSPPTWWGQAWKRLSRRA